MSKWYCHLLLGSGSGSENFSGSDPDPDPVCLTWIRPPLATTNFMMFSYQCFRQQRSYNFIYFVAITLRHLTNFLSTSKISILIKRFLLFYEQRKSIYNLTVIPFFLVLAGWGLSCWGWRRGPTSEEHACHLHALLRRDRHASLRRRRTAPELGRRELYEPVPVKVWRQEEVKLPTKDPRWRSNRWKLSEEREERRGFFTSDYHYLSLKNDIAKTCHKESSSAFHTVDKIRLMTWSKF